MRLLSTPLFTMYDNNYCIIILATQYILGKLFANNVKCECAGNQQQQISSSTFNKMIPTENMTNDTKALFGMLFIHSDNNISLCSMKHRVSYLVNRGELHSPMI